MAIVSKLSELSDHMLLPMGRPTVSRHKRAAAMLEFIKSAYAANESIAVMWETGAVVRGRVHAYTYQVDTVGQPDCEFILKTGETEGLKSFTVRGTWIRIYGFDLKEPSIYED